MIPKIIHYCWFGGNPLPELALKCIDSWKKHMPDYEIMEWNESNFDVNIIPYTQQAYEAKKYAYVSDYSRMWILYHFGGIYLDTDVEVLKDLTPIIEKGPYMGCENRIDEFSSKLKVATGLGMACEKSNSLVKDMMNLYENRQFTMRENNSVVTVVTIISDLLYERGLKSVNEIQVIDNFYIYPAEYFAPRISAQHNIPVTDNTYTKHHYARTWMPRKVRIKIKLLEIMPNSCARLLMKAERFLKRHIINK